VLSRFTVCIQGSTDTHGLMGRRPGLFKSQRKRQVDITIIGSSFLRGFIRFTIVKIDFFIPSDKLLKQSSVKLML
jgi:hypothetical protein